MNGKFFVAVIAAHLCLAASALTVHCKDDLAGYVFDVTFAGPETASERRATGRLTEVGANVVALDCTLTRGAGYALQCRAPSGFSLSGSGEGIRRVYMTYGREFLAMLTCD